MTLYDALNQKGLVRSKRQFSRFIGRSLNYACENRLGLGADDLLVLWARLRRDGHADLAETVMLRMEAFADELVQERLS